MWKGGGTTSAKGGYDEELGKWQAWHGGGGLYVHVLVHGHGHTCMGRIHMDIELG